MVKKLKEIVIPKEKAVFWLDKHGLWRGSHGKFQKKKIIDHFHASIRKDRDGYYLTQINGDIREKVYFPYEDTALFVFDVIRDEDIILELNTRKRIALEPARLFIKADSLYMHAGDETVKFNERSLIKISALIESVDGQYVIRGKNRKYAIPELHQL